MSRKRNGPSSSASSSRCGPSRLAGSSLPAPRIEMRSEAELSCVDCMVPSCCTKSARRTSCRCGHQSWQWSVAACLTWRLATYAEGNGSIFRPIQQLPPGSPGRRSDALPNGPAVVATQASPSQTWRTFLDSQVGALGLGACRGNHSASRGGRSQAVCFVARRLNTSSIRPPRASHPARLRSATLGPGCRDRLLASGSSACRYRGEVSFPCPRSCLESCQLRVIESQHFLTGLVGTQTPFPGA